MSTSWLPKFLKGQGRYFMFKQMGACSQEVLAVWLAWQQDFPRPKLAFYFIMCPYMGLPRCSVCVFSLHVASRIPSLAIHAPHSGPCVRLRIVGLHSAQPQLTVVAPDSIEKPVHHSHTHTAAGCRHGMALFPAIGDRVEHFHHIQGITCIKICYSN